MATGVENATGTEEVAEGNQENFEELSQEQLAAQFKKSVEVAGDGTGDGTGEGGAGERGTGGDEFKSPLSENELSVYNQILGTDIPEDVFKDDDGKVISKEDAVVRIKNMIEKKSQSKLLNDSFINKYVSARSKDGFNQKDFIKELTQTSNILDMSSKDFMTQYLKDKKHTDEEISEFLDSKKKIELDELADSKKNEYIQSKQKENAKTYQEFIQRRTQELDVFNEKVSTMIDSYTTESLVSGKHPLKIAESEIKGLSDTMKELTRIEFIEVDGRKYEATKLDTLLNDNKFLLKVLPFMALEQQGKLDDFMHQAFSKVKEREFEKIDGANALGKGGNPSGGTNWSKFIGNS